MKKYFLFDNEPIKGTTYLIRFLLCTLLAVFIVGLPLMSATAYKRAGAIGWSRDLRITAAVVMPIYIVLNLVAEELAFESSTFLIIVLLMILFHLVLIFKNGNKII